MWFVGDLRVMSDYILWRQCPETWRLPQKSRCIHPGHFCAYLFGDVEIGTSFVHVKAVARGDVFACLNVSIFV